MAIWWLATSKNEGHCSYNELKYRKVLAQGWPKLGDLTALIPVKDEGKFKEIINQFVNYVYDDWKDERDPGRIILNLLKFRENDLVLCTEGQTVKGIAKVGANPKYRYDNGDGLYEYAQTISPIAEWKDWDTNLAGPPPPTKAMGPVGINHYGGDEQIITQAWEKI
jgi:hypothetical protein